LASETTEIREPDPARHDVKKEFCRVIIHLDIKGRNKNRDMPHATLCERNLT
jgi:hypothetical protein